MNFFLQFRYLLSALSTLLFLDAASQSYSIAIENKKLVSANQFEFDVLIKADSANVMIPLKFFQAGYRFSRTFINGGLLSAAYVPGTCELESAFGKTWGFSYSPSAGVLNQSANIGSVCPGAFIGSYFRRIGKFRIVNSVSWGCEVDSLQFVLSGSGHLTLALAKYRSADCSDPISVACTQDARTSPSQNIPSLYGYMIALPDMNRCDSLFNLELRAEGGLPPYSGAGIHACSNGYYQFTISDSRGCETIVDTVFSSRPMETHFTDSSCGKYVLPWGDTAYLSGLYSHRYLTSAGCDSIVHADIQIIRQIPWVESHKICKEQLPYQWRGLSINAAGEFQISGGDHFGCDSVFILKLIVDSIPMLRDSISGLSSGLCLRREVAYSIGGYDSAYNYLWQVPEGADIMKGQSGNSILVDYSGALSDGRICVTAHNHCGSGQAVCKNMSLLPIATNLISGQNTVRKGQKLYYAISVMGATAYQWIVPVGWQILSGQGSSRIYVRTGPQSGIIKVLPSNSCGMGSSAQLEVKSTAARVGYNDDPVSCILLNTGSENISIPVVKDFFIRGLALSDMSGRLLKRCGPTDHLDVSMFPPGLYLLTLTGESGTQNHLFRIPVMR
jgi:hypothetical protein